MFFNSPSDAVAIASAFFSGVAALVFGAAAYYAIKNEAKKFFHPKHNQQAVRNK